MSDTSTTSTTSTPSTTSANSTLVGIMGMGGSKYALSDETLDKLKAADENAQIKPITTRIESQKDKQEQLNALISYIKGVDVSFTDLANEANYLRRKVNSTGTSATITSADGVAIQNMSIDVAQLAQGDSYKTRNFDKTTDVIGAEANSKFEIKIGEHEVQTGEGADTTTTTKADFTFSFELGEATTLQDLADMINSKSSGMLNAKLINVGKGYQMVLQTTKTGAEQNITFSNISGNALEKLGWDDSPSDITAKNEDGTDKVDENGNPIKLSNLEANRLTTAQDAEFTYNGLAITRSSNTITDLRVGVTITLNETGKSSASIVQDTTKLQESLKAMTDSYNNLLTALDTVTKYDEESGEAGALQGINDVTKIRTQLNSLFLAIDAKGRKMADYGISFKEGGELAFDEATFQSKIAQDPDDVQSFFMGTTTVNPISYTGQDVKSGSLSLTGEDLVINGVAIKLDATDAASTSKENALALMKAINDAKIAGIEATLSSDETRIILKAPNGDDIDITGNDTALAQFGFNKQMVMASTTKVDGAFSKLTNAIDGMIGKQGSLTLYNNRITETLKTLDKDKEKAQTSLDTKYNSLREYWAKYDTQIAALENQFESLKQMIEAEYNKD
ncbi:MAG: flagellar filament capping protein FliD [Campylobacter sp.]|nr:flagellar filament capping protein FliD [Campylobacter sp.]